MRVRVQTRFVIHMCVRGILDVMHRECLCGTSIFYMSCVFAL